MTYIILIMEHPLFLRVSYLLVDRASGGLHDCCLQRVRTGKLDTLATEPEGRAEVRDSLTH